VRAGAILASRRFPSNTVILKDSICAAEEDEEAEFWDWYATRSKDELG
jgi:hypothetical protein